MMEFLSEKKLDLEGIKELLQKSRGAVNVHESTFGWSPILFAAHRGDVKLMSMLLEARADVNGKCKQGNTALHLAARRGNVNAVSLLQSRGADIEEQSIQGWTPLMWSAIAGCPSIASALLDANASPNARDSGGRTACMWAARHGHADILRCLLSMGTDLSLRDEEGLRIRDHAMYYANMQKTVSAVTFAADEDSEALYRATSQGALDLECLLRQHGASSEGLPGDMLAPLEAVDEAILYSNQLLQSARRNDWEAAEEALRAGACASTRGESDSLSPLIWAAMHDAPVSAFSLVAAMADLEARDPLGWTALHHAVHANSAQMVAVLHYLGADFSAQSENGDYAQHLAALSDAEEMLQLLGPATPDWNIRNAAGQTPLQVSAVRGCLSAVQALLALNADVNVKDEHGQSVLALAAARGHLAVVQALVDPVEQLPLVWPDLELNKMLEKLPWVDSDVDAQGPSRHGGTSSNASVCSGSYLSSNVSARNEKMGTKLAGRLLERQKRPMHTIKEVDSEAGSMLDGRPMSAGSQRSAAAASHMSTQSLAKSVRSQASVQSVAKSACSQASGHSMAKSAISQGSLARSAQSHVSLRSLARSQDSGISRGSGWSRGSRSTAGGRSKSSRLGGMPSTIYTRAKMVIERSPLSLMKESCKGCSDDSMPPLLASAAALSATDSDGSTPLILASSARQTDMVRLLLELKAAPDASDSQGNTPLMLAAKVGDQHMLGSLLDARASVDAATTSGLQAVDLAADREIRQTLQAEMERSAVEKHMKKSCSSLPKLVKSPVKQAKSATAAKGKPACPCRVRLDGLPTRAPAEQIEAQVRETLRCCRVASPLDLEVALDPITLLSRGHAFLDYGGAEQVNAAFARLTVNVLDMRVSIEGLPA